MKLMESQRKNYSMLKHLRTFTICLVSSSFFKKKILGSTFSYSSRKKLAKER